MAIGLKTLVLFTCLPYLFIQVVYNGLLSTSVSSIQTRYHLSGVDVGIIIGMMDVASIFMLVIVAYVGEDANKPKWLGINSIIVGVGVIIFAIPHFTSPEYQYQTSEFVNHCGNVTEPDCVDKGLRKYMGVFILGMVLVGGGFASILTFGITYIDDNSTTRQSSVYISVFYIMAAVGSMMGFIGGGAATDFFVNPTREVDIDSSSPFWVGAWWPVYLVVGSLSIISSFPILKMPSKLPSKCKNESNGDDNNPTRFQESSIKPIEIKKSTKIEIVKELLTCPIFLLSTLVNALSQAFIMGFNSFGIKYGESQFDATTFQASLAYGITAVLCITLGQITSATIMAKFNLNIMGLIKYCMIGSFLSALLTFCFFVYCPAEAFAGGSVHYHVDANSTSTPQLNSSCNAQCGCTADWYNPVRGSDGIMYYSPCYAGCQFSFGDNDRFENCSCILEDDFNTRNTSGTAIALKSIADRFCLKGVVGFTVGFGLAVYSSIMTISPNTQITMRYVGEHRKSTAVALKQLIALGGGNIPGRVIAGKVLDLTCIAWSTKCGNVASCKVYNRWDLALYAFLLLSVETILIFLAFVGMYFIHRSGGKTLDDKQLSDKSVMTTVSSKTTISSTAN